MMPEEIVDPASCPTPALIVPPGYGKESGNVRKMQLTASHPPVDFANPWKRPGAVTYQDTTLCCSGESGYLFRSGKIERHRNFDDYIFAELQGLQRLLDMCLAG